MGRLIGIVGPPGAGKTTSMLPIKELNIKGLNPKETVYINVATKELPMRLPDELYNPDIPVSKGGNYAAVDDPDDIKNIIQYVSEHRFDIKNIVIDDLGYVMSFDVMRRVSEKNYEKWTELARDMFYITEVARKARPNLLIFTMFHQENSKDGTVKIKTAGQLIDKELKIDGLYTTLLFTENELDYSTKKTTYGFRTQSFNDTAKSPVGMFKDLIIPNDLGYVRDTIVEFYGIKEDEE